MSQQELEAQQQQQQQQQQYFAAAQQMQFAVMPGMQGMQGMQGMGGMGMGAMPMGQMMMMPMGMGQMMPGMAVGMMPVMGMVPGMGMMPMQVLDPTQAQAHAQGDANFGETAPANGAGRRKPRRSSAAAAKRGTRSSDAHDYDTGADLDADTDDANATVSILDRARASGGLRNPKIPIPRVKAIMKEDEDVLLAGLDGSTALAFAAESFLEYFAKKCLDVAVQERRKTVMYRDMVKTVQTVDNLQFLEDLIPPMMPLSKAKEMKNTSKKPNSTVGDVGKDVENADVVVESGDKQGYEHDHNVDHATNGEEHEDQNVGDAEEVEHDGDNDNMDQDDEDEGEDEEAEL
ncbi:hypothetical protein BC830DRAFT_1104481 [Chytriomyces sp. MP71]|nr:hypothetical protein BC830DRAFT_1104481 [Chytriomyces sp. MP71]